MPEEKKPGEKIEERPKSRFIQFFSKFYKSDPASIPSAQTLETFKFADEDFQTEKGKKQLYTIFRRYPSVFNGVKLRASLGIRSVDIITKNSASQRVISKFLKNLHPTSGLIALADLLRELWADTDVFGTSFLDPIWNKEKTNYTGLKRIHPISMDLQREQGEGTAVKLDKKENPVGWIQDINNVKKELTFKQIQFLTFTTVGDETLGVATLEPIYKTVWRLMNIEEGLATAIFRHGFPLYDIQVAGGIEGRPPTKEQLDDAAKQVKGLNYKSEFIHPPNYKVKLLEAFSIGKGEDYTGNFLNNLSSALGLPKFMLLNSAEEDSGKVSETLLKSIKPNLKPAQDKIKLFFEEQILQPLMEANHIIDFPELVFGEWPLLKEEFEDKFREGKDENPKPKPKDNPKSEDKSEDKTEEKPKETKETKETKEELAEKSKKQIPSTELVELGLEKKILKEKIKIIDEEIIKKEKLSKITYEEESEIIKKNKNKPEAKKQHKFKAAEWTHKNGHPRCLICGDEEMIGGICNNPNPPIKDQKIETDLKEKTVNETVNETVKKTVKTKPKKLPGLYMREAHADMIVEGAKKQILKSKKEAKLLEKKIGKEMYLISDKGVLGIIKLREPREIDINEFINLRYAHLISDEERQEIWPKEKSLMVYEFEAEFFTKLKTFKMPKDPKILISGVQPE